MHILHFVFSCEDEVFCNLYTWVISNENSVTAPDTNADIDDDGGFFSNCHSTQDNAIWGSQGHFGRHFIMYFLEPENIPFGSQIIFICGILSKIQPFSSFGSYLGFKCI